MVDAQHADVDRQVGADPAVRDDIRPQLLATLPHDGGGFVLARFHPAAGQLPPAGQLDGARALGDEQPPVADQGGGDDRRRRRERFRASRDDLGPSGEDPPHPASDHHAVGEPAEEAERGGPAELVAHQVPTGVGVRVVTCASARSGPAASTEVIPVASTQLIRVRSGIRSPGSSRTATRTSSPGASSRTDAVSR